MRLVTVTTIIHRASQHNSAWRLLEIEDAGETELDSPNVSYLHCPTRKLALFMDTYHSLSYASLIGFIDSTAFPARSSQAPHFLKLRA